MSPELCAALTSWLTWVENGAPEGQPFGRSDGLCHSVWRFGRESGRSNGTYLKRELGAIFSEIYPESCITEDCSSVYPFGYTDYHLREKDDTQHECPKRLAWVRAALIMSL